MKRSRWPIVLVSTLILISLFRLAYPAIVALAGEDSLQGAWERARHAGSYRFMSAVDQTLVPRAIPEMIGEQEQKLRLIMQGAVQLPDRAYIQMWAETGRAEVSPVALLREGNQTFMQQEGQVTLVENPTGLAAPTADWLAYLAAAENVRPIDPVAGETADLTGYRFDISGPRFAEHVRQQTEAILRQEPGAPPGLSVGPSPVLQGLSGQGELWVDADGLPVRQVLDLEMPEVNRAYDARIHMAVDLRDYGAVTELPRAMQDADGTWRLEMPAPVPPAPVSETSSLDLYAPVRDAAPDQPAVGGPEVPPIAGASFEGEVSGSLPRWHVSSLDLVLFLFCLVLAAWVRLWICRKRLATILLVTTIIPMLVLSPLLQAGGFIRFAQRQALAAETRAAAAPELAQALGLDIEPGPAAASDPPPVVLPPTYPAQVSQAASSALIQACGDGDPDEDTDQDGLNDQFESCLGTDPYAEDSDGDGLSDKVEIEGFEGWTTSPLKVDSNKDGMLDLMEWPQSAGGLAPDADVDGDGTPNVWDDDNDGDGVPDNLDLSPMAVTSSYADTFDLTIEQDPEYEGYQYIEFQVQPQNPAHLRYSTTALDWPYDDQGNMQDRNDSKNDIRLSPALLIPTNVDPGADLQKKYGFQVWPSEDGNGYDLLVPLFPVGTGGAVHAFQSKVAYGPEAAAFPAIHWQDVRMVWLVQAKVDDPRPRGAVLHRYSEDAFRLTGLQVSKSADYEFVLFATPTLPQEDRELLKLQIGLNATFIDYERLEHQKPDQTALEHVYDRFGGGYDLVYTWGIDLDQVTVERVYQAHGHHDAGAANMGQAAAALLEDHYASNRCGQLQGVEVTCGSLVLAYEEDLGVNDLGDLATRNAEALRFNLQELPVQTMRGVRLNMYERYGPNNWQVMGSDRMMALIEGRYGDRYESMVPEESPYFGADGMRFLTYATYLGANAGSLSTIRVGEVTIASDLPDESALMNAAWGIGSGYWSPGQLGNPLPLTSATQYSDAIRQFNQMQWYKNRYGGKRMDTFRRILKWNTRLQKWDKVVGTGIDVAGAAVSVWSLVCQGGGCDGDTEKALEVSTRVVQITTIPAAALSTAKAAIEVIGVQKGILVANTMSKGAVIAQSAGLVIGLGMAWISFGLSWTSTNREEIRQMALAMAIVTTIWMVVLFAISFIPVVGQLISAILALIDALIIGISAIFGENWSVSRVIVELFYSVKQHTEPLDSPWITGWHSGVGNDDPGLIEGSSFEIQATHHGRMRKTDDGSYSDLDKSWIQGVMLPVLSLPSDLLPFIPFLPDPRGTAKNEPPKCERHGVELECNNTIGAYWTKLSAGTNITLTYALWSDYQYTYGEYALFGLAKWKTRTGELRIPEEPEPHTLYVDILPATLDELWAGFEGITNPDRDGDKLANEREGGAGCDPDRWDTDGDGLSDGYEVEQGSAPNDADSDDDGLADGLELGLGTGPMDADTDDDGLSDGEELAGWAAHLPGGIQVQVSSDPLAADADGDGLSDLAERENRFSPYAYNPGPVLQLQVAPFGVGSSGNAGVYVDQGATLTVQAQFFNGSAEPVSSTLSLCLPGFMGPADIAFEGDRQPVPETGTCAGGTRYDWSFSGEPLQPMEGISTTLTAQVQPTNETTGDDVWARLELEDATVLEERTAVVVDRDAPGATFDAPLDGAILSGENLVIGGTAGDPTSWVDRVDLALPGYAGPAAGTSPWAYTWALPGDGAHTLRARATDHVGNWQETTVEVTVDNTPPNVTVTTPDFVRSAAGAVQLEGTAGDATSGLARVQISINQGPWRSTPLTLSDDNNGTWTYDWRVGATAQGSHSIRVRAVDRAGNTSAPLEKTIIVDQVPPSDTLADRTYLHAPPAAAVGQPHTLVGVADEGGYLPRPSHPALQALQAGQHVPDPLDVYNDANLWLGLSTIFEDDQGAQAAWLGDVNNDRMADLAVGLPAAAEGAGQVIVVYGRAGDWAVPPDLELLAESGTILTGAEGAGLGSIVAAAGDVNGDSLTDLLVGQAGSDRAFLVFGRSYPLGRLALDPAAQPLDLVAVLRAPDPIVGLAAAGDSNGDGLDDVLVTTAAGQTYLLLGESAFRSEIEVATAGSLWEGDLPGDGGPGDVDGDGTDDRLTIEDGHACLILGDGGGCAVTIQGVAGAAAAPYAAGADINGDGSSDLLLIPSREAAEGRSLDYGEAPSIAIDALPRAAAGTLPPQAESIQTMATGMQPMAAGDTIYVDDDDPTCGGNDPCYDRIETAVDLAAAGTTIVVGPGVYPPFDIGPGKDHLIVRGVDPDAVFVDGGGTAPYAVQISSTVGISLTHMTLRNAERGVWLEGAGVLGYVTPTHRITLDHLLVHSVDHALAMDRQSTAVVRHSTLVGRVSDLAIVEIDETPDEDVLPQWEALATGPDDIDEGGALVRAGDTLYALSGGDSQTVYQYATARITFDRIVVHTLNDTDEDVYCGGDRSNGELRIRFKGEGVWSDNDVVADPNGQPINEVNRLFSGSGKIAVVEEDEESFLWWCYTTYDELGDYTISAGALGEGSHRFRSADGMNDITLYWTVSQLSEDERQWIPVSPPPQDITASSAAAGDPDGNLWLLPQVSSLSGSVYSLVVDPAHNLYVGGDFNLANGGLANYIARWNGTSWTSLDDSDPDAPTSVVRDIEYAHPYLYVVGPFGLKRWNSDSGDWERLGTANAYSIAVDTDGSVYVGGAFETVQRPDGSSVVATNIARWGNGDWTALSSPGPWESTWTGVGTLNFRYNRMEGAVYDIAIDNNFIYVGGDFGHIAWRSAYGKYLDPGSYTRDLALFDKINQRWQRACSSYCPIGVGFSGAGVRSLQVAGSKLLVAGSFSSLLIEGPHHDYRDCSNAVILNLSPLQFDSCLGLPAPTDSIVSDGSSIFAGGEWVDAGGNQSADYIARWDGWQWSSLGNGMDNRVRALALDGAGNLFAGGDFAIAGGISADNIARWNGSQWSALRSPFFTLSGLTWQEKMPPEANSKRARMTSAGSNRLFLLLESGRLLEYSISSDIWTEPTVQGDQPPSMSGDFALAWAGGSLYTLRGTELYRYEPGSNSWTRLADAPQQMDSGLTMAPDRDINPQFLYAMGLSGNTNIMMSYGLKSGEWTSGLDVPDGIRVQGSGLAYKDRYLYLYAWPTQSTNNFYRYGELKDPVTKLTFESTAFVNPAGGAAEWSNLDPIAAPDFAISLTEDNAWVSDDATWGPEPDAGWGERLSLGEADFIAPAIGAYRVRGSRLQAGYDTYHPDAAVYPSRQACIDDGRCGADLTWGETAFDNIQAAVDSEARRVLLRPGVYPGPVYLVSGVEILGAGAELSVIEAPVGMTGPLVRGEGIAASTLANVTLAGNGDTTGLHLDGGALGVRLARDIVRGHATGVQVNGSGLEVVNNAIVDNVDGMRVTAGAPLNVRNTIFAFNSGTGLDYRGAGAVSITYNDFWANGQDLDPAASGGGNIFLDPLFVTPFAPHYRLSQWSPAIDAGDPSDPAPPGTGGVVDIGYREYGRASYYADHRYGLNALNDGLTWGVDAFDSIGDALAAAAGDIAVLASGDSPDGLRLSVGVGSGTYHERVRVPSYVRLVGSGADETTIDAGGTGSPVTFDGVVQAEVSGFTLTGAEAGAAGVAAIGASNTISVSRNLIAHNHGHGVRFAGRSSGSVRFNTIADNAGAGLLCTGRHTWLEAENNIVVNNNTGLQSTDQGLARNAYNLVVDNGQDFSGAEPGEGTISEPPAFGAGYSLSVNSPALDAASPYADVPPGGGVRADMGYKELLASPLVLFFGPEIQSTVIANAGVAGVQIGITALDPALASSLSFTETLPADWDDVTLRNPDAPYSLWRYDVTPTGTELYRVYSRASDVLGNSESDESLWYAGAFVGDDSPPEVSWVSPSGDVTTEAAAVELVAQANDTVDDGRGPRFNVAQVTFTVNGQAYPAEWIDGVTWQPGSGQPRTFRAWVPLETGSYTVQAVAVDGAGHSGQSVERTITVVPADPPDAATITSHTDGQAVNETELELAGYVRFSQAGGERHVAVQVGSDPPVAALLADSSVAISAWQATVTLPAVDDAHPISVTVNAQLSDQLTLTLDRQPPALTVLSPQPGDYVTRTVAFEATADDANGLAVVQVSVDGGYTWRHAERVGDAWQLTWELTTWQDFVSHPAMVRAADVAGNETRLALPVTVDNLPPTGMDPVTFSPEPGNYIDTGMILDISWEPAVDASGQVTLFLEVDQSPVTEPSQPVAGTNHSTQLSSGGQWYVHLAAQDAAGNQILRHYGPWHVDEMQLDGYIDTAHNEWTAGTDLLDDDERPARTQRFFATWDSQAMYLGWQGAWWPLDGTMWAYLGPSASSTPRVDGLGEVPLAATHAVEVIDSETGRLWVREGVAWSEQPLEFVHSSNGDTEVRLPWSGPAYLIAFVLDETGTPRSVFPTTNPLAGPWTEVYGWTNLSLPPTPNAGQPQAESVALSISSPQEGHAHWGPGDELTYRINVHNHEVSALSDLHLFLSATPGLGYQAVSGATCASCPPDGDAWELTLPTLQAGSSHVVGVTGQLAGVDVLAGLDAVSTTVVLPVTNLGPARYSHRVDGQPPSVAVHAPPGNGIKAGADVSVSGTADDGGGSGVALVEIKPQGGDWQPADGRGVWTAQVDVPDSQDRYSLEMRVTDRAGNETVIGHEFIVDKTPPTLSFSVPPTLTGSIALLHGSTIDPAPPQGSQVARLDVQLYGEDRLWLPADGPFAPDASQQDRQSFVYFWDLPQEDGVTHVLRARAIDVVGNISDFSPWQQTFIDNVAPVISVTTVLTELVALDQNPVLSGTVSDGSGVSALRVWVEPPQGALYQEPAELINDAWHYNLLPRALGVYSLTVEAQDPFGNISQAGPFALMSQIAYLEADCNGPYVTDEGVGVVLDGTGSTGYPPLDYAWDFDGDGDFDDATGPTPTFDRVGQDGIYPIALKVTDPHGAFDIAECTVTVIPPSVITLLSFAAQAGDDGVTLAWETGSEVDNAGFNVWRSEAAEGPYAQINEALIPAQGDAASGTSYSYVDGNVVKGVAYYYKLEDVDLYGVSTFHGPVSATPGHFRHIYLPLLFK